jgi:hypothetical protein
MRRFLRPTRGGSLEAEADRGVVTIPLSKYVGFNIRICRPVGLDDVGKKKVIDYALARIGKQYDSKRIVDLARYLFPYPPVPVWFRRRMLAIGSGDPTPIRRCRTAPQCRSSSPPRSDMNSRMEFKKPAEFGGAVA